MVYVTDDIEVLSFKTPRSRKRLAKILAAKWNMADVSELMNALLKGAIDGEFDASLQRALLVESKKRRPPRTGDDEAAA